MIFNRDEEFSPKEDEQSGARPGAGSSPATGSIMDKSNLLKEETFRAGNQENVDEIRRVGSAFTTFVDATQNTAIQSIEDSAFSPLANMLSGFTYRVRVGNFKEGIITPLSDLLMGIEREAKGTRERNHKESTLYMAEIRNTIARSNEKNTRSVSNAVRETYYGLTKSITSALATVVTPIFKTMGVALFGIGKADKTVVQSIEEQTSFLRTGQILDNSTMFSRFMRRGIVGSALAAGAGALGIGREASQRAENNMSEGRELNFGEKTALQMRRWLGLFGNIDKKDLQKSKDSGAEQKQLNLLDRIRLTIAAAHEFSQYAASLQVGVLGDLRNAAVEHLSGIRELLYTQILIGRSDTRQLERRTDQEAFEQASILTDIQEEIQKSNSPMMSTFEHKLLEFSGAQTEALRLANELAMKEQEERKRGQEAQSGGGIIGMITGALGGLGGLLFGGAAGKGIMKASKRFLIGPIKGAFKAVSQWIKGGGAKRFILGPIKGAFKAVSMWFKSGGAKRFILGPVMGAIKSGGAWIKRNGFKLLLRAPFAKAFAIGMIAKLLYDHLLRPMIGWFDNTFGTEIGKTLDGFTSFFTEKFVSMVDWIKGHLENIPVIGRMFKDDEEKDKEPVRQLPSEAKVYSSRFSGRLQDEKNPKAPLSLRQELAIPKTPVTPTKADPAIQKQTDTVFDSIRTGSPMGSPMPSLASTPAEVMKMGPAFVPEKSAGVKAGELFNNSVGVLSSSLKRSSDTISDTVSELSELSGKGRDGAAKIIDEGKKFYGDFYDTVRPGPLRAEDSRIPQRQRNPQPESVRTPVTDTIDRAKSESTEEGRKKKEEASQRDNFMGDQNNAIIQLLNAIAGNTQAAVSVTSAGIRQSIEEKRKESSLDFGKW